MLDRSPKIDKWVRSDEDFKEMSWHDVVIHGLAISNEMLSGPDEEPRFEPQELLLDIDYVLNWREVYSRQQANTWISPATLVFTNVSNLTLNLPPRAGMTLLIIYNILREANRWTVALDEGQIAFDSTGFKQCIRREPVSKSNWTYLSDSERGGFSFGRARD